MRLVKKSGHYYLVSLNLDHTKYSVDDLLNKRLIIATTNPKLDLIKMSKSQVENTINKKDLETISKSKMIETKYDFPYKNYYQIGFIDGYYQAMKDIVQKDNSSWKVRIDTDPIYQEPIVDEDGVLNIIEILG